MNIYLYPNSILYCEDKPRQTRRQDIHMMYVKIFEYYIKRMSVCTVELRYYFKVPTSFHEGCSLFIRDFNAELIQFIGI